MFLLLQLIPHWELGHHSFTCLSYAGLPIYLLCGTLLILRANWALFQIPECYSLIVRCCITCLILNYFYSLTSSLTEETLLLLYHMLGAPLFLQPHLLPHRGLTVISHVWCSTVFWPKHVPYREHVTMTPGASHLWFPVVWLTQTLYLYCGCYESTRKLWGGSGSHCGSTCGAPVGDLFFPEFLSI